MRPEIKPIGVGDLKIIKQQLARYEAGELAHIENILATEKRDRRHRRFRQIEETVAIETQREEEARRDLQSTERFELQAETERTAKSETSLQAGLDVSASYGPVSLSAYAKFASTSGKEESDKNSTKYAKELTEKSVSRLLERKREERTTRNLEQVEEKNQHGFDNTNGGNITGVYRWVDKYYRAKVVNYGKRLMYEFFVPEPGSFHVFAEKYRYENGVLPVKPSPPTVPGSSTPLSPSSVTRQNWSSLAKTYGAQGIEPPPPQFVRVSRPIAREYSSDHWAWSYDDFDLPAGYRASSGAYAVVYTFVGGGDRSGAIHIGVNRIDIGVYPALTFASEIGRMPVSATGYGIKSVALNVEVVCELSPELESKWKLATFNAVMTAYNKALMEYEERVAAAQIQQGVAIKGDNPLVNRQLEKDALKKASITMWTGEGFSLPSGIFENTGAAVPGNFPEINRYNAAANARLIEFLEESFEWNNVTYELYPYYWGRKTKWLQSFGVESTDPLFERFLKAGAARVVVPVKPSATERVLFYQLTGIIWSGGPVPSFSSIIDLDVPLYNSYVAEMAGVADVEDFGPELEIDSGDPDSWLIKVPTDLVWLQGDGTLPDFES